jgi:hypothetical protein
MRELYDRGSGVPIRKNDLSPSQREFYEKQEGIDEKHALREHIWPSSEIIVNKSLETVLMAAPPKAVARAINSLAPNASLANPRVCQLVRPKGLMKWTGRPDLVLFDQQNGSLVLGEIKIGAKKTNERYKFEQLKKYMQLGLLARTHLKLKHVAHLVIVPSQNIAEHCDDPDYWKPDIDAGRQLVSRDPDRFRTMLAVYQGAAQDIARTLPIDVREFLKSINPDKPLIPIPTYVATWDELGNELTKACNQEGAGYLAGSCELLKKMGVGTFALPQKA